MQRPSLEAIARDTYDVAVIGGGINGAGAAQELAARGYRVVVVDKGDFAQGATSRSSRILHCGLRHLAPGKSVWEFALQPARFLVACNNARKSMDSQKQISATLDELVRPFQFCFPIYDDGPYTPWQVDAGFRLLKMLGPRHYTLDYVRHTRKTLDAVPYSRWLRERRKLQGIAVFRDYQFVSAGRMVIDTLKDAYRMGAVVRNYTQCRGARRAGGAWHLEMVDTLGQGEAASVRAQLVINATGPWGDSMTAQWTGDNRQRMVGLKGIHIAVKLPQDLANWGLMSITRNGETLYCLPWKGMHYIGPTRTPYSHNLDAVVATAREVDWVLGEVNYAMPGLGLMRRDILFTWAGVQPVTFDGDDPKGTRAIRIHDLESAGAPGMLMLTGGPIMTFRIVGAELADAVSRRLAPSVAPRELCYAASAISAQLSALGNRLPGESIPAALLRDIVAAEQVMNLTDLCLHRTHMGDDSDQGLDAIEATAAVVAELLGWDPARMHAEVAHYRDYLAHTFPDHRAS